MKNYIKHTQLHTNVRRSFAVRSSMVHCVSSYAGKREQGIMISCDKFFQEPHRLRNGDIDTSPLMADDPQCASHFSPTSDSGGWPFDTSDDVIHRSVVSKHVQSLSEVNQLKKLRPNEADYPKEEPVQPVEPSNPVEPKTE